MYINGCSNVCCRVIFIQRCSGVCQVLCLCPFGIMSNAPCLSQGIQRQAVPNKQFLYSISLLRFIPCANLRHQWPQFKMQSSASRSFRLAGICWPDCRVTAPMEARSFPPRLGCLAGNHWVSQAAGSARQNSAAYINAQMLVVQTSWLHATTWPSSLREHGRTQFFLFYLPPSNIHY